MEPELQVFSVGIMIFSFIIMDEWLFWTYINRYIYTFGLDLKWLEVGSGFFLFWRLVDYDKRNIR